jgi:hypothetical protein
MSDVTAPPRPWVIHPLDDLPEPKLYSPALGRMTLTRKAKLALLLLQAHIGLMLLLLGWRALTLSGIV